MGSRLWPSVTSVTERVCSATERRVGTHSSAPPPSQHARHELILTHACRRSDRGGGVISGMVTHRREVISGMVTHRREVISGMVTHRREVISGEMAINTHLQDERRLEDQVHRREADKAHHVDPAPRRLALAHEANGEAARRRGRP